MTVVALRAEAKKMGLTGYSKLNKADLVKLVSGGSRQSPPKTKKQSVSPHRGSPKPKKSVLRKTKRASPKPSKGPRKTKVTWGENTVKAISPVRR